MPDIDKTPSGFIETMFGADGKLREYVRRVDHNAIIDKITAHTGEKIEDVVPKWEYKIEMGFYGLTIDQMNQLGKEGWEMTRLCSIDRDWLFYFKRQLATEVVTK